MTPPEIPVRLDLGPNICATCLHVSEQEVSYGLVRISLRLPSNTEGVTSLGSSGYEEVQRRSSAPSMRSPAWSIWKRCCCLASRCAPSANTIRNRVGASRCRPPKRASLTITKLSNAGLRRSPEPLLQRDLSLTGGRLARKWIADCKPIDCLTVSHVLRVECAGANMERSRDDE